jgi:hypothetical protein
LWNPVRGIPFGVYDLAGNEGWVSVGIDHDTSRFAVGNIRNWWLEMGRHAYYPCARELAITADSGGGNGSRRRMWKTGLQRFADETDSRILILRHAPLQNVASCQVDAAQTMKDWRHPQPACREKTRVGKGPSPG